MLLDAGANINSVDHEGETPLHYAEFVGNTDMTQLLLQCGVDSTIINKHGYTALYLSEHNTMEFADEQLDRSKR